MGLSGVSAVQLLIVLGIVVVIFGTKRIRQAGGDLGAAVKGFRAGFKSEQDEDIPTLEQTVDEVMDTGRQLTRIKEKVKRG